jgi:hypothetical protein
MWGQTNACMLRVRAEALSGHLLLCSSFRCGCGELGLTGPCLITGQHLVRTNMGRCQQLDEMQADPQLFMATGACGTTD